MREQGLQSALFKERRKETGIRAPDLFQVGELTLRKKGPDSIGYVGEFALLEEFPGISRAYRYLAAASVTARFFQRNLLHLESFETAWDLLTMALRAFSTRPHPEATLFKLLYRFAREEGYPVTRGWLHGLSVANQVEVETLLSQPLDQLAIGEERILYWVERLSSYFERETAIYAPDWHLLARPAQEGPGGPPSKSV